MSITLQLCLLSAKYVTVLNTFANLMRNCHSILMNNKEFYFFFSIFYLEYAVWKIMIKFAVKEDNFI